MIINKEELRMMRIKAFYYGVLCALRWYTAQACQPNCNMMILNQNVHDLSEETGGRIREKFKQIEIITEWYSGITFVVDRLSGYIDSSKLSDLYKAICKLWERETSENMQDAFDFESYLGGEQNDT